MDVLVVERLDARFINCEYSIDVRSPQLFIAEGLPPDHLFSVIRFDFRLDEEMECLTQRQFNVFVCFFFLILAHILVWLSNFLQRLLLDYLVCVQESRDSEKNLQQHRAAQGVIVFLLDDVAVISLNARLCDDIPQIVLYV